MLLLVNTRRPRPHFLGFSCANVSPAALVFCFSPTRTHVGRVGSCPPGAVAAAADDNDNRDADGDADGDDGDDGGDDNDDGLSKTTTMMMTVVLMVQHGGAGRDPDRAREGAGGAHQLPMAFDTRIYLGRQTVGKRSCCAAPARAFLRSIGGPTLHMS